MRADYVDAVKARLYRDFYRDNKGLYDKDRMEYWRECIPYCEKNFRKAMEKYLEERTSREEWGKNLPREIISGESFKGGEPENLEKSLEKKPSSEEDSIKATIEYVKRRSLGARLGRLFQREKNSEKSGEENSSDEEE